MVTREPDVEAEMKRQVAVKQVWVKFFLAPPASLDKHTPDMASTCCIEKGRAGALAFGGPSFCGQVCTCRNTL